jgi:Holliday junction resolvase
MNNKRIGARFEGEVRKALRSHGYFIYTKGISSAGIDIFGLKDQGAV